MISSEEVKRYLPKFLSSESEKSLLEGVKQFPRVNADRFYSSTLDNNTDYLQGDGIKNLLIVNLPDTTTARKNGLVVSNSCDISPSNKRLFSSSVCYSPIFQIQKYEAALRSEGRTEEKISDHLSAIRAQEVNQIFHLPKGAGLEFESFVFLDRIISAPISELPKDPPAHRLFTLSNYGYYLFLVKLSIHFTRLRDGVDRDSAQPAPH